MNNQQTDQSPKIVEELKNFPFKTFSELKNAKIEGIVNIGVDRGVALKWAQWSQNGIYSPSWLRIQVLVLTLLPFIAIIGFIIYAILTKSWLLLLSLPILLICLPFLNPGSGFSLGGGSLALIGILWGLINGTDWLTIFSLTLVIIWYALRTMYRKAVNGLILAVLEHEDLLCLLWSERALSIHFYNGNSYWSDWKTEDGKDSYYDGKKL